MVPRVEVNKISKEELFKHTIRPTVTYDPTESYSELVEFVVEEDEPEPVTVSIAKHEAWKHVFKYLPQPDLCTMMQVSKLFLKWCSDPVLWEVIDLSECELTQETLKCVSRRTPVTLNLARTNISYDQLMYIISKNKYLRNLKLGFNSWAAVVALNSANCPLLISLDLAWVSGFGDPYLAKIISAPTGGKPGQQLTSTIRLKFCEHLNLTGTDITDAGVKLICQKLPNLKHLNSSYCDITDEGLRCIINTNHISEIVTKSCPNISDKSVDIKDFEHVNLLDLTDCLQVTEAKCKEFVSKNTNFYLKSSRCIVKSTI